MSVSALSAQSVLKAALEMAHEQVLEGTMKGVSQELANRPAPGNANPIGSSYAHVALSEDIIVNGMLQGKPPLFAGSWAGRTGVDKPMPWPGMVEGDLGEWYHSAKVDLPAVRQYAQAVFASTRDFIESASDETLAREIEVFSMRMTVATAFEAFVIGHCNSLGGEISAIKGVFGMKGYPF